MLSLKDFIVDGDSLLHKNKEYRIEVSQEAWDVYFNDEYCGSFYHIEKAISYVLFDVEELEK